MRLFAAAAVLAASIVPVLASPALAAVPQAQVDSDAFLSTVDLVPADAAAVNTRCDAAETLAKRLMSDLAARTGAADIDGDFRSFDALNNLVNAVGGTMYFVAQSNTAKPVRDAAQACSERMAAIGTDLSLSRPIYDRLSAIPTDGLDEATAFILGKRLMQYRLAGVDKDAATRDKVGELNKQITNTGLEFDRNISEYQGDIVLDGADALAGMPQDYIDAHKPGKDGKIHLTTAYPDVFPALEFADNRATRKAVYLAFVNRAWPGNAEVLRKLIAERTELASTLGYANYAALVTADKMIGTPAHARAFLDEVNAAAADGAAADDAKLLARLKQIDPGFDTIQPWDTSYLNRLVRKEQYDVDSALVRQYFTLDKARAGIFGLVHDLFGGDIKPWKTAVWAPGVTAWELYDGKRLVGRFYLDLSPREGKFSHAAQFTLRNGLQDRQVPIAGLLTNFPATGPMDHGDVTTFLHEFGHLLHTLYSGHQEFASQSMDSLEWDFIEAPSQLLEEWTWDYDTLKTFASNPAGEPIPQALVEKMNVARHFGDAGRWKRQLGFSAVSLAYYGGLPEGYDLDEVYRSQYDHYATVPESPDAHMYAAFGHLNGYSAIYYTYVWSKAIALDLATRFKAAGLRDTATALAYRKAVLDPGGSKPAAALIEDFLGRPSNTAAFREELAPR
jgi:thimet oligopeptidase